MAFQDTAESLRSKLLWKTNTKAIAVGIALILIMVVLVAGKLIVDATAAQSLSIERAATANTNEGEKNFDTGNVSSMSLSKQPQQVSALLSEDVLQKEQESVTVHVVGAVATPGVYTLPYGSRANAAVEAAGGLTENAAAESINLARTVVDGEQIFISAIGEEPPYHFDSSLPSTATEPSFSSEPHGSSTQVINVNSASASELETLPGIGPALAQRIIDDRETNGFYNNPEDLKRVSGIGDKKYETLSPLITVA